MNSWGGDGVPKVLIVEDDQTMSEMLAYNLRRQGLEVEAAADGVEGLKRARDHGISLIVLDLMLPSLDGLSIADELRKTRPDVPILMLTARAEEESKLRGFAAGADDYITKPFSMDELRLATRDFRCWIGDDELDLRPKEFSLLVTLAAEPGRLFTRVELAERVWGYTYLGDTRTIDTHVKNVRRKVEEPSRYRYIDTVRGVGYRFRVRPKE